MPTLPEVSNNIHCPPPDSVHMHGLIGRRFDLSRANRLLHQEEDHLLFPFHEHCPVGMNHPDRPRQEIVGDWQGEYIGTWLDAAILTAWNTDDHALHMKIRNIVSDWLSTQDEDGYLGTYDEKDRWKSWDVWVQAHDLIGLISYYRYTREDEILNAAVRVADRVLQDFGPGKRYLYPTGPHGGMASSSFLEPLIWLYWETGNQHYLDFGRWLVDIDWEQTDGPRIISSLADGKGVAGTANAKGIEMLICFAGMVELYRATGESRYLESVLTSWQDIVEHHLYITGSASTGEYFMADYTLRNDGLFQVGETCVSMGWLYLNLSLGQLTGEARFYDMAEQTLYNHLLAAQSPDGRGWAYYVGLRDSKRYRWHIDPECCPTRGVRALAQMPRHVFGITEDGVVVNFYEPAKAAFTLQSGINFEIQSISDYPFDGRVKLALMPEQPARMALDLRLPAWCKHFVIYVNTEKLDVQPDQKGYLHLERQWQDGDIVELSMDMPVQVVMDRLGNVGRVALTSGPLVYAADSSYLPKGRLLDDIVLLLSPIEVTGTVQVLKAGQTGSKHLRVQTALPQPEAETRLWRDYGRYHYVKALNGIASVNTLELVPFFEAGNREPDNYRDGIATRWEAARNVTYQIWMPYRIT